MKKYFYPQFLVIFSMLLFFVPTLPAQTEEWFDAEIAVMPESGQTASAIYDFFKENPGRIPGKKEKTDRLIAREINLFYLSRAYKPVWNSEHDLLPIAYDMIAAIHHASEDGLNPDNPDYNLARILQLLKKRDTKGGYAPKRAAQIDILLTNSFFMLGYHLHYGLTYGMELDQKNGGRNHDISMGEIFRKAIENGNINEGLAALSPKHPGYIRLKKALARYMGILENGGWNIDKEAYLVTEQPYRHAGDIKIKKISMSDFEILRARQDAAQNTLRRRLIMTGDLDENETDDDFAQHRALKDAVIRFQKRHQLKPDGIVGKNTVEKMTIPVHQIIEKIRLNMERWRWLPMQLHNSYITVNIPGLTLTVTEAEKTVLSMQTIVGMQKRKTPIFNAMMNHLVLNPYWRLPKTVLKEDVIPRVREDIDYLRRKNIKIFSLSDINELHPIDPAEIDWYSWKDGDEQKYLFRQEPGPRNALGYVKFMFPNKYDIYIHDTPSKALFYNGSGLLSSGCIRVRKPMELAEYLLKKDQPDITYKDIFDILSKRKTHTAVFKNPIPVYITYQTAWADENGMLNFSNDVYGFDKELMRCLKH